MAGATPPLADLGLAIGCADARGYNVMFARPGLSDETAYLLARAIHRAEPKLAASLQQARETTMANLVAAAPSHDLIHPGARKYLREIGLIR